MMYNCFTFYGPVTWTISNPNYAKELSRTTVSYLSKFFILFQPPRSNRNSRNLSVMESLAVQLIDSSTAGVISTLAPPGQLPKTSLVRSALYSHSAIIASKSN